MANAIRFIRVPLVVGLRRWIQQARHKLGQFNMYCENRKLYGNTRILSARPFRFFAVYSSARPENCDRSADYRSILPRSPTVIHRSHEFQSLSRPSHFPLFPKRLAVLTFPGRLFYGTFRKNS